ncbi:MAG TPA: lysylphosphatidylglycerol synthase transmembrane domain-containing protein [Chitinophagales bacterium]|nr:lysylphosphatidylglycerol synthase transmembrane domain-containing protein [Chitinophagales bacterium]
MKKHIGNFIKLAVSLGIGVGLVYWFVGQMSDSDKQQVLQDIKRANYFWVAVPPLLGLLSNYFRAERWRLLLQSLGYKPGAVNTFLSVMMMYFLNLFFPRLGEVSRCGVLARYENIPVDKAIGTMVLERLMDVICLAVVSAGLLIAEREKFLQLYHQIAGNAATQFADIIAKNQINPILKYGVMLAVLGGLIVFIGAQIRAKGFENIKKDFKERSMGLIKGIISIKDVKSPLLFVFHTVMIWALYILMAYTGFMMFPETSGLGLAAAAMCLFFSGVAFSLTPGGLGLYPIFMQIVLTLYGVVGSAAISFGLVQWTAQTLSVLVGGVLSLILLAILNREPSLEEQPLNS